MQVTRSIRQLIGESAVYGISGALGRLIAFFLIPVYTRVFTPADLGIIALIDATVTLATMLAILGLDGAAARWFYDSQQEADHRETIASSFWCQMAAAVLMAGLLIAGAVPVARLLCGSGDYADLVRLAAGVMPLGVVIRALSGWLRYRRKAPAAAVFATLRSLLTVSLVILFVVVWYGGLPGLYTARLLAAGISAAVCLVLLGTWIDPRRVRWSRLSRMLAFGLPLVPATIAAWIMTSADLFVLRIFWPEEVVGLYNLGARLAAGTALAIYAFQQAWGPFAYSIMENDESRRVYVRVLDVYMFFGCWMAAAVGLFAPLLLRVMATEEFYAAASCVAILAFVHLFIGARSIAGLGSSIAKRSAPVAVAIGIGAGVNLLLNFRLVPHWGREGAAMASVIAAGISMVYLFAVSQKAHHIDYRWRLTLCSLAMSAGLVTIASLFVAQTSPAGLAVRFAMLLGFVPLGLALGIFQRRYFRDFFKV